MQPGEHGSDQHAPRESEAGAPRSGQGAEAVGRPPRSAGVVAAGMGVQFVISLLVFLFLGQWLDRRLGTAPVFLLVCVFVGAGGSFYLMYRTIMAAQRREDEARSAAKAAAAAAKPRGDA